MDDEEHQNLEEDNERVAIRQELSQMSFEELKNLKESLGAKVYNEAVFGRRSAVKHNLKRKNKNRPVEMSSKVKVPLVPKVSVFKEKIRDPRFDSLCGSFNERAFKSAYRFVDGIREKERQQLQEELNEEMDEERKNQIKYLLTRIENQKREEKLRKEKEDKLKEERELRIHMLRQGKFPKFKSKAEAKITNLVDQYEKLKKSGKLRKHIEKQRKKNTRKDRRKLMEMT